jgi:hypothetical protein
MKNFIFTFCFSLAALLGACLFLFFSKKNIRSKCGSPKDCSCKNKCKKNEK